MADLGLSGDADLLPCRRIFERGELGRTIAQGRARAEGPLPRLVCKPRAAPDHAGIPCIAAVGGARFRDDHGGDGPRECEHGDATRIGAGVVPGCISAGDRDHAA